MGSFGLRPQDDIGEGRHSERQPRLRWAGPPTAGKE